MTCETYREWEHQCDLYAKNKEALGFNVTVKDGEPDGLVIKTDVAEKYKTALSSLIKSVVKGAVDFALTSISFSGIKEEDSEDYAKQWMRDFNKNKSTMLSALLSIGLNDFYAIVFRCQERNKMAYFLTHMEPSFEKEKNEVCWSTPDGFTYNEGSWTKRDGDKTIYHNDSIAWDIFFA